MDSACRNAIADLQRQGARGLPTIPAVEGALDGEWKGRTRNGGKWTLRKDRAESYFVEY
jgi:hypothetical protein